MKRIIFFFLSVSVYMVNGQTIRFNKSYVPIGNDYSAIYNIVTKNGYLCYGTSQYLYPQSLLSFRIDSLGNIQIAKIYGDTNIVNFCEDGESIIRNDYNPYLIALRKDYNYNPYIKKIILYKFLNTDTIYTHIIQADTMTFATLNNCMADSFFYSIGTKAYGTDDADHYDVVLLKSDMLGNLIWEKHYGGSSMDIGYKITNTYDNKIIIGANRCGYYTGNNPYYTNDCQWWIVKMDAAGNVIWSKDFGNPDVRDGQPRGLIETADSNYIITGSYAVSMYGSAEMLRGRILKLNPYGNVVWDKLYGSITPYTYASIIKRKNNNDLICIFNDGPTPENGYAEIYNPFVLCLTPTGDIKWFRSYYFNQDPLVDASVLNSFDFTSDGGYIFAGYGVDYDSVPAQRSWVIKTDSLGFDGVTDFSADTAYRIELSLDTCYGDTGLVITHTYGITAPYTITYTGFAVHDSLYYSPLYEPYISDTLILTSSMLTGNDSIITIPCTVTDGLGRVLHDTLTVNVGCLVSSINTLPAENGIRIYPNPAISNLTVEITNDKLRITNIEIVDLTGKRLLSKKYKVKSSKYRVDIGNLPTGIYFVKVETDKGTVIKKFIVN